MDRRQLLGGGGAALLAAWVGGACSGSDARQQPSAEPAADEPDDLYVPGRSSWESVEAEEAGWSATGLDEVVAFAGDHNTTSLVMVAGGRLLVERYWGSTDTDTSREIASCQKSVVSTLCGMARDRSLLALDDAVSDHLGPGWSAADPGDEARIDVRHLLTMTSGLDPRTLRRRARPGTGWRYNTAAYQKLRPVLEAVTDQGIGDLTRDWLFDPLGVSARSTWSERPRQVDATGQRSWSLAMTARDLARFGLLAQRRGHWGGDQVVPAAWFDEAWTPSQELNPLYGYLWWLLGRRESTGTDGGARTGTELPADLVAALGARDQKVYVCPGLDLVVVRQGGAGLEGRGRGRSRNRGGAGDSRIAFDDRLLALVLAARN
jgi:CubicO group peptidase (beta-lactamase class C family)